jgi:hypothetical protein
MKKQLMLCKKDGLMENQSPDGNMAHLDFRQAISSPGDHVHAVVEPAPTDSAAEEAASRKQKRTLATRLPRLQQSDRTTFLFATLIFVGGLFCAFFFFNGAEILRAAAAWSREFLYPRPAALMANDRIDNAKARLGSESPASSVRSQDSNAKDGNKTAPFSRSLGSLYSGPFGDPSGPNGPALNPSSPLGDLNVPPPGGDALLQSLNQAAENIARATSLFANSTATVVKRTVVQTPSKATSQLKSVRQNAPNIVSRTSAQAEAQNARQAANVVNRTQTRATNSAFNLHNNLGQGLGGLGGGVGGLGGDAASSLGGAAGGAAGGALGGIGGSIGIGGL